MSPHDVMSFFKDTSGNIKYNEKCNECKKECKQSFRAVVVHCPLFIKNGRNENDGKSNSNC